MPRKKKPLADKQPENSQRSDPAVHLTPHQFKPGQSGNPNGRPKRKTLTERMAEILERSSLDGIEVPPGECVADVVARSIIVNACQGKFPHTKELIERLEGKVPDRLIDETPDADADRDRTELASLLATLRERAGIAPPQVPDGPAVPRSNGDGHE